jgi:hypothetical protein
VGIAPGDVTHVVITHMRGDHSGGIRHFPDARIVLQKPEYEYAMSMTGPEKGFFKSDWDLPTTRWEVVEGDVHVGPGVVAHATYGHTPGHQAALIRLPDTGAVIIPGDAAATVRNLDEMIAPGGATDLDAAMHGLVLPIAGYKGLALINEILSAVLPGAILSVDVSRRFLAEDATSLDAWGVGHLAITIDVAAFQEPATFINRVANLADRIRGAATAANVSRIMLPGDPELDPQRTRERDGIPMTPALLGQLRAFAVEAGVDPIDPKETAA